MSQVSPNVKADGEASPDASPPLRGVLARAAADLSPAMRQYIEQKSRVGEAILLFRMGDFYETFYEDAKTVSRVLGLTLTSRDKKSAKPIPLAGIPYHALDRYVARLVQAGFKVAISEQIEDPKTARGVVKRDIDRIITPGTLTDENLLDERRDNLLVAAVPESKGSSGRVGVAFVSLSSGRFVAHLVEGDALADELARIGASEALIPEGDIGDEPSWVEEICNSLGCPVTMRPAHAFDAHLAKRSLCDHFQVAGMAGFGFDAFDASHCAAAAVLDYLRETQKSALAHIVKLTPGSASATVGMDRVTLRSLEIERTLRDGGREGTLLWAVDRTVGPMGARLLREWLCFPLIEAAAIRRRQDAIAALVDQPARLASIRQTLAEISDVERILSRVGVGRASPRDLAGLGRSLGAMRGLVDGLDRGATADHEHDLLGELSRDMSGHDALGEYLPTAIKGDAPSILRDGGFIEDGFDAELDRLRGIGHEGDRFLAEFQAREAQRSGIPSLKVGYNSVFGYYIEITHQHRDRVPPDYVRKQTIRNAERYITDELKRHEREVTDASDRAKARELELFEQIRAKVAAELPRLQAAARAVAKLDVVAAMAELARREDFCKVELIAASADDGGGELEIIDGRHPVLSVTLREGFVPNDCRLAGDATRLALITGPNMAGKSTYIRQVALLTLLAQSGGYVPARSMRLAPVDRIFARVGANDEISRGHSTFMVEMVETARILNNATPRSLIILDEIGRGTSTYDGLAIAWAVTEHLGSVIRCRALFATHYHELTELADALGGAANFNVAVREQLRPDGGGRGVVFLHKIVDGPTDRSYGVHVASMAGLPLEVVRRSEQILEGLERRRSEKSASNPAMPLALGHGDQLSLFDESPEMPQWCRRLVDAVRAIDPDLTTPLDALRHLASLQRIADSEESG